MVTKYQLEESKKLKILIISLKSNVYRRSFQQQQAARLGLDIEFVDAVSAGALSPQEIQSHANQWTRSIRGQDVACTLSHWKVWEIVAAQKEKVCILEDDVLLSANFRMVVEYIEKLNDDWNCIYDLEYALFKHTLGKRPMWRVDELRLSASKIFKNKRGAAAYIVGPLAAQRLRAEAMHYWMMEAFLWTRRWATSVQIEPCQAVQLDIFDPSLVFPAPDAKPNFQRVFKNQSWFRSKMVRASVSLNEAKQAVGGAVFGSRRLLHFNRNDFQAPKNLGETVQFCGQALENTRSSL